MGQDANILGKALKGLGTILGCVWRRKITTRWVVTHLK
jgi:hypothetical protein